jgi:hypothetical protein
MIERHASTDDDKLPNLRGGVKIGGGPPPGYFWNVQIFEQADREGHEALDDDQYDHMADQVRELARQPDPTHSQLIDIRPVEDFYEIRDKGGVLGKLNVRLFYFVNKNSPPRAIVVLGLIKKQNNGNTPMGDKIRMRRRKRLYEEAFPPSKN